MTAQDFVRQFEQRFTGRAILYQAFPADGLPVAESIVVEDAAGVPLGFVSMMPNPTLAYDVVVRVLEPFSVERPVDGSPLRDAVATSAAQHGVTLNFRTRRLDLKTAIPTDTSEPAGEYLHLFETRYSRRIYVDMGIIPAYETHPIVLEMDGRPFGFVVLRRKGPRTVYVDLLNIFHRRSPSRLGSRSLIEFCHEADLRLIDLELDPRPQTPDMSPIALRAIYARQGFVGDRGPMKRRALSLH